MRHVGELQLELPDDDESHIRPQLVTHELRPVRTFFLEVLIVQVQLVVIRADLSKRLQVWVDVPPRVAGGL